MKCKVCGEEIKAKPGETELSARCDHLATHNASPAQWTEAYNKIQAGKERSKKASNE